MEKLNLSECTTNKEVSKLVTDRIREIPFNKLLIEVEKSFIFQTKAIKAIYTGLSMNMNVFLSGPGGYGKSTLIKHILDIYNIPYHSVIGYKDMPVDALLGIPDMNKLLKESKYEINFKESIFCKPGILIGEEFTDILPSTAAALKDVLTERGFRNKDGKVESLISTMIIAANKSSSEVIDDESKRAFYQERFPIQVEVKWVSYKTSDYFKLLRIKYKEKNVDPNLLFFMAKLFSTNHEEFNNTVSPRVALDITNVYLNKGINFIDHFAINTNTIDNIKLEAKKEFNKKTVKEILLTLEEFLDSLIGTAYHKSAVLYAEKKIRDIKIEDDLLKDVINTRTNLINIIESKIFKSSHFKTIDQMFNQLQND
jgi:MoxR-like ATPase